MNETTLSTIMADLEYIQGCLGTLEREVQEAENKGPIETSRAFVRMRRVKDFVDEVFKPFNTVYEKMKVEKIPQIFETAGVPSINLDEGFRITVSHKLWASIKGGKKEEAYVWLKENGLEDLITETVNSSTLSAAARTMVEDNVDLPDELFSVAIVPNTSITKTK